MNDLERNEIIEEYRKWTGLFKSEEEKQSFYSVYKNLKDSTLLDLKESFKFLYT